MGMKILPNVAVAQPPSAAELAARQPIMRKWVTVSKCKILPYLRNNEDQYRRYLSTIEGLLSAAFLGFDPSSRNTKINRRRAALRITTSEVLGGAPTGVHGGSGVVSWFSEVGDFLWLAAIHSSLRRSTTRSAAAAASELASTSRGSPADRTTANNHGSPTGAGATGEPPSASAGGATALRDDDERLASFGGGGHYHSQPGGGGGSLEFGGHLATMEHSEKGFAKILTGGVVGKAFLRAPKQEAVGTAIGGGGVDGVAGGGGGNGAGGNGAGGGAASSGERYNEKAGILPLGIIHFEAR